MHCSCVYSQMFYTTPFHALWGIFASYFLAPAARTCHALGVQFKAMSCAWCPVQSNVQAFAEQNCQHCSACIFSFHLDSRFLLPATTRQKERDLCESSEVFS